MSSGEFVNDGDCIVCGPLKEKIEAGEVKPCFEWERVKEDEDNESAKS